MVDLADPKDVGRFYAALHGLDCGCPTCGARGKLDTLTEQGKEPAFEHSVWWNGLTRMFECWDCWLK